MATRGQETRTKKTNARALVTLVGDRALMVTLLMVTNLRTNRPKAGTCQHVRIGDGHFTYVTLGGQEDQLKPGPRAASTLTMG